MSARELLQLRGLEDLPVFTAEADPLHPAIDPLDRELQQVQAQRAAERSRRDPLTLNLNPALPRMCVTARGSAIIPSAVCRGDRTVIAQTALQWPPDRRSLCSGWLAYIVCSWLAHARRRQPRSVA